MPHTITDVPGYEGTVGPFRSQYGQPHVYARDVHSGSGNCVCGNVLEDRLHVQIVPGVDSVPKAIATYLREQAARFRRLADDRTPAWKDWALAAEVLEALAKDTEPQETDR